MKDTWLVTLNVDDRDIIKISNNHIAGIGDVSDYEDEIRESAKHLLGFIGELGQITDYAELEALRTKLAERDTRVAEWKAIAEHLISVIGNANLADTFIPHVIKLLVYIEEKELADNLSVTGFASTLNESEKK